MKRRDARSRIIIAMAAGAVLLVSGLLGGLGPVQWLYDSTIVPLSRTATGAGTATGDFFSTFGQISSLSAENAKLKRENAELRGRLAGSADAERENADLRRQLGMLQLGGPKQVGADVVAFQPDSYRQFLTINRGTKDGLKVGQAVLSEGIVIGTVSDVSPSTAKVQLVTDPEFALTVRDQETGAMGVLRGQLGGGLKVDKIGQTEKVNSGDTIATSGLGDQIPAGLFIGPVQTVNKADGGLFQSAVVTSSLRTERIRFVFVVVES